MPEPVTVEYCVQRGHAAHSQGTGVRQDGGQRRIQLWNNTQLASTTY